MKITLGRDPFARTTTTKRLAHPTRKKGVCDWCGTEKRTWNYYIDQDGIYTRPEQLRGQFCDIACANSFHN